MSEEFCCPEQRIFHCDESQMRQIWHNNRLDALLLIVWMMHQVWTTVADPGFPWRQGKGIGHWFPTHATDARKFPLRFNTGTDPGFLTGTRGNPVF